MLYEKTHLWVFIIDHPSRAFQLESLENQQVFVHRSRVIALVKEESTCVGTAVASAGRTVLDHPGIVDLRSKVIE